MAIEPVTTLLERERELQELRSEGAALGAVEHGGSGGAAGERQCARAGGLPPADEDLARARRWGAASGIGVALRAGALVGDISSRAELGRAIGELPQRR